MNSQLFSKFLLLLVFSFSLCCYSVGAKLAKAHSRGHSGKLLGNLMDFSWKLPEDGGGGDSQCEEDIRKMYSSLNNMTLWAFQMWEATAGGTNGWIHGSNYQLGYFDECLGAENPGMERQYCLATINITKHPTQSLIDTYMENFRPNDSVYDALFYNGDVFYSKRSVIFWGICTPASCSNRQLEVILQKHVDNELMIKLNGTHNETDNFLLPKISVNLEEKKCQKRGGSKSLGSGVICFILITSLTSLAVLIGSVFHWYIEYKESNKVSDVIPYLVRTFSLGYHLKGLTLGAMGGNKQGMDVFWGIRVISLCFFIVTHRIGTKLAGPILNKNEMEQMYHKPIYTIIYHGDLLVDSFLVLSGVLSFIANIKVLKHGISKYPFLILYRYIRIVSIYALVILFTAHILPLTGSGPLWSEMEAEGQYCRENWWANLLMVNNYVNVEKMCMVHSWYVPCDFHLFLVSLVISLFFRNKSHIRIALSVTGCIIVISMLIPAIITYVHRLPATMLFTDEFFISPRLDNFFRKIFIATHTRASPYFIGFLAGYIIFEYNKAGTKILSMRVTTLIGVLSIGVLAGVMSSGTIFYQPYHRYNVVEAAFYAGFQRSIWALALSSLIMCCIFGDLPIITTFLAWSGWVPLGKLSYGAYLIHMGLQIRSTSTSRTPYYMDHLTILGQAFGDIIISFGIALFMYVTVEVPVRKLFTMPISAKIAAMKKAFEEESHQKTDGKTADAHQDIIEMMAQDVDGAKNGENLTKSINETDDNLKRDSIGTCETYIKFGEDIQNGNGKSIL